MCLSSTYALLPPSLSLVVTPLARLTLATPWRPSQPDGYVYSWDTDRLWRKSRQPVGSPSSPSSSSSSSSDKPPKACFGIDLNRNWGYEFQRGARPNPCSDSYPGREPFESVELQALRDYLVDARNGVDAFFDVHSFGQMRASRSLLLSRAQCLTDTSSRLAVLFPYSFSCNVKTADEENHYEAVLQAAKALRGVHGRQFETGSVCEISLTSPGMSLDWTCASRASCFRPFSLSLSLALTAWC